MWKSIGVSILMLLLLSASAYAELFPDAIHITREVTDSLSGTTKIEEYYVGDRAILMRDHRTSIADYATGELTEIDRRAGTYSVTRFEAVATAKASGERSARQLNVQRFQLDEISGTIGDGARRRYRVTFDASDEGQLAVEVAIDPTVRVSEDFIEVLTGSAWPLDGGIESAVVKEAARTAVADARRREADSYGLPVDLVTMRIVMGEAVRMSNTVTYTGAELPPTDLVAIPPGAREVISRTVERARLLEELDQLPAERRRP